MCSTSFSDSHKPFFQGEEPHLVKISQIWSYYICAHGKINKLQFTIARSAEVVLTWNLTKQRFQWGQILLLRSFFASYATTSAKTALWRGWVTGNQEFQKTSLAVADKYPRMSYWPISTKKKHCKIANRCPEYISPVVKMSSCFYQQSVLSFHRCPSM